MTHPQSQFRAALLDPEQPEPRGLGDGRGGEAGARFNVYRNNVVVSLKDALATAFPLVRKLIGAENFASLSGVYVRAHPPTSPLMMFYGAEFPAFLEGFAPLRHLGYLADCARLDLALRRAYHAADHRPVDPTAFADAKKIAQLKLKLAPSAQLLSSAWPLFDLWRFNMVPESPAPRAGAQDVLVARCGFDPAPHLLPPGAAQWFQHLDAGLSLTDAVGRTTEACPAFDLQAALTLALQLEVLTSEE